MVGIAVKEDDDKCKYYFYSQSLKEVCIGYDLDFARNTLYNAGWIENQKPKQVGIRNDMLTSAKAQKSNRLNTWSMK